MMKEMDIISDDETDALSDEADGSVKDNSDVLLEDKLHHYYDADSFVCFQKCYSAYHWKSKWTGNFIKFT